MGGYAPPLRASRGSQQCGRAAAVPGSQACAGRPDTVERQFAAGLRGFDDDEDLVDGLRDLSMPLEVTQWPPLVCAVSEPALLLPNSSDRHLSAPTMQRIGRAHEVPAPQPPRPLSAAAGYLLQPGVLSVSGSWRRRQSQGFCRRPWSRKGRLKPFCCCSNHSAGFRSLGKNQAGDRQERNGTNQLCAAALWLPWGAVAAFNRLLLSSVSCCVPAQNPSCN